MTNVYDDSNHDHDHTHPHTHVNPINLIYEDDTGKQYKIHEPSKYLRELRRREHDIRWPSLLKPFAVQNILLFHTLLVIILYVLVIYLFFRSHSKKAPGNQSYQYNDYNTAAYS